MRESIWLTLRQSSGIRRLQAVPIVGRLVTRLSYLLVPTSSQRWVRVQSGPGEGLLLTLNPRFETTMWRGTYELPVQVELVRLLGAGKVLYDVGGGLGFYSLLAARLGARALVFEPDPYNAGCIRRHAEVNGWVSNIEVVESAVYSHTGWVTLKPADQTRGHGNAHVVEGQDADGSLSKVPCTTLDDFLEGRPAPNVVKVDVEGAESEVLRGAEKVFAGPRPHLICEVHGALNAQFAEQWLKKMGYEIRWFEAPETFPVQLLGTPC